MSEQSTGHTGWIAHVPRGKALPSQPPVGRQVRRLALIAAALAFNAVLWVLIAGGVMRIAHWLSQA